MLADNVHDMRIVVTCPAAGPHGTPPSEKEVRDAVASWLNGVLNVTAPGHVVSEDKTLALALVQTCVRLYGKAQK